VFACGVARARVGGLACACVILSEAKDLDRANR
jgi:hypothetical protein